MMEKHYSLKKAAELLGVTTQTLRNWDNAGKIKTIRTPGNQRRIPESEIERLSYPGISEVAAPKDEPKRSTVGNQDIDEKISDRVELSEDNIVELPPVILKSDSNHLLMCKDVAIYDITQDQILDESLLPGCMLKGVMNFSQWMETRYSKETNYSSQRLKQRAFDSFDYEHVAFETGALSLSDCYWIKKQDEDTQFMDVTSYIHFNPLSNLFVSGKADKLWIDAQSLLKVNSFREIEPYALCSALGLENVTEAQRTDEGIVLNNFTSPDVFYESMEQSGIIGENTDSRDLAIREFKELAVALFVVDYLVENNDRHADDHGFLRSANTGEYISMAPY